MVQTLLKGGMVLSLDTDIGDLEKGDVLVEDDRIIEVAPRIEASGAREIDVSHKIVMPGLVNAHMHTWQTNIRGIAGDWTMAEYQAGMHRGLAMAYGPDDIYLSNLIGALNQINNGVTTLFDWSHNNPTPDHSDRAIDGLAEAGIRAVYGHGTPKPKTREGETPFTHRPHPREEVARLREGRLASEDGLITLAMCILGPDYSIYDVTHHDVSLAREFGLIASQHMGGGVDKMNPDGIARLSGDGLLGPWLNVVHGNNLKDDELKLLADSGATLTVTPEIEYQMGFGYSITGRWIDLGRKPSIGVDVESDIGGDMFSVMRFTLQALRGNINEPFARAGKAIDTVEPKARDALLWATLDSATALRLDNKVGTLTPGKQADIITINTRDLNLFPVHDPLLSVVFQANPGNVRDVMIAGEFKKRDGNLVYGNLEARMSELEASGRRILTEVGIGPGA
ncbi:MAG: amidohydrolase family protein [Methyloligellaceae bacterium]